MQLSSAFSLPEHVTHAATGQDSAGQVFPCDGALHGLTLTDVSFLLWHQCRHCFMAATEVFVIITKSNYSLQSAVSSLLTLAFIFSALFFTQRALLSPCSSSAVEL